MKAGIYLAISRESRRNDKCTITGDRLLILYLRVRFSPVPCILTPGWVQEAGNCVHIGIIDHCLTAFTDNPRLL